MIGRLPNLECENCGEPLFDHNSDEVRHCLYSLTENIARLTKEAEEKEEKEIKPDFRTFMNGGTCERCDRRTLIYPDIKLCRRCYTELEGIPEERFIQ